MAQADVAQTTEFAESSPEERTQFLNYFNGLSPKQQGEVYQTLTPLNASAKEPARATPENLDSGSDPFQQPSIYRSVTGGDPKHAVDVALPYFAAPGFAGALGKAIGASPAVVQLLHGALLEGYHKVMQATGNESGKVGEADWRDALNLALPYLDPAARSVVGKVVQKFGKPAPEAAAPMAESMDNSFPGMLKSSADAENKLIHAKIELGKRMKLDGMSDDQVLSLYNNLNPAQVTQPMNTTVQLPDRGVPPEFPPVRSPTTEELNAPWTERNPFE